MRKLTATICLTLAILLGSAGLGAVVIEDNEIASFRRGLSAYEKGDYATALREWTPLAEQGDANAQTNLGVIFYKGQGVPQNYMKAAVLFRLSAEQGSSLAQTYLSGMYAMGQGITKDKVYAYMWGNIAASNGNEDGAKLRDINARYMNPSQLEKAQDLVRECVRKKYKGC